MTQIEERIVELQKEIKDKRSEIHTDNYPISIGEVANMYRDEEISINPLFQRRFRWSDSQKSKFIESIFLGIPIPSLFVAARRDSVWDVVDGVQRLSTIFEFMGILKDPEGKPKSPSVLTPAPFLKSLEGVVWNKEVQKQVQGQGKTYPLSMSQQIDFKRAKLDFKIILQESDDDAKFELFQRLNTDGVLLSDQEIRNAKLAMLCPPFLRWLEEMAATEAFVICADLSEKQIQKRYDLELVLRFLSFRQMDIETSRISDVREYLDKQIDALYPKFTEWKERETDVFIKTFSLLKDHVGADVFKKYLNGKYLYRNGFIISGFEAIAMGLGYNIEKRPDKQPNNILGISQSLWGKPEFADNSGAGVNAATRTPKMLELGRNLFNVK